MKYCQDCVHAMPSPELPNDKRFLRCALAPEENPYARVTPEPVPPSYKYCVVSRCGGDCGPDAKLFEPKANTDEADIALAAAIGTGAMK